MRALRHFAIATLAGAGLFGLLPPAFAKPVVTQPEPWQMGLQPPATPIAEWIHHFNDGLMIVVTVIVLFVLGLLVYCMLRFNARANPVPSKTSHNTLVEVVWTVLPILILVGIAIPSFSLLFAEHDPARAVANYDPSKSITIKATGRPSWYWTYDYPDNGDISVDSQLLPDADRTDPVAQPRLLAVDNPLVVPTGTVVRMLVTADPEGIIHAFAVPSFGIKVDAIPGRLNETWFLVEREGTYFGQCSELCGRLHAFMPIEVRAVSPEKFAAWVAAAKTDLEAANKLLADNDDGAASAAEVASK
jgi:cytochrome c oxidase subunit 2